MADLVMFHHAQGLTEGVALFAEELRSAGHVVHVPDLYDGHTFDDLDSGLNYAQDVGFETLIERGAEAAAVLPAELVYVGISLGAMPAQRAAQTRPGALGMVFISACLPPDAFGSGWPDEMAIQIHAKDADPMFVEEDLPAARALVAERADAELFCYPGDGHLFTDAGLADYDADATTQVHERMNRMLHDVTH